MEEATMDSQPAVRTLVEALTESLFDSLDALGDLTDAELDLSSAHPCAMGGTIRDLLTHNVDHERMHTGQVYNVRYMRRTMQNGQVECLLAEWLRERAALIASLIGLTDEQLDGSFAEGEYSIRETVEHVIYWEKDSVTDLVQELRERRAARVGEAPMGISAETAPSALP
jgi:uncharacterized damage-inducible protein DinB